jgi:hypothetical protein
MKYILLSQFEKQFHRTPFKAVEDMTAMTADEQRWFVWQYRCKTEDCPLTDIEEWTSKEFADAVSDFFGVAVPSSIPS